MKGKPGTLRNVFDSNGVDSSMTSLAQIETGVVVAFPRSDSKCDIEYLLPRP
jgi:hypothetical protein